MPDDDLPDPLGTFSADVLHELRTLAKSGKDAQRELHTRLQALGVTKMGGRLKAIGALTTPTAPPEAPPSTMCAPVPQPDVAADAASAASSRPRVAILAHTGYFTGGTFGGATRASLALLREARRICGAPSEGGGSLDVFAITQTPVPDALVFKFEDDKLGELMWEGERVLCGRRELLIRALRHRSYDVVISLSIEEPMLPLALALNATVRYATPHNYYLPPFGPFKRFEVRAGHIEMLARFDALLSPCEHHCAYLRRWSPLPLKTRALFAADYHCAQLSRHPAIPPTGMSPRRLLDSRRALGSRRALADFHCDAAGAADVGAAIDVTDAGATSATSSSASGRRGAGRSRREVRLPPAMEPWEPAHRFVTFVSPSPEKGLAIFAALAQRMPDIPFAAVCTQWTGEDTLTVLGQLSNVCVLAANPDVDVIFRQTKVLLAPSLWQECCPLIVMEACLRGIPCVSSDVFGLPEANLNANLVVHTTLSYDHARGTLHHDMSNDQLEKALGASPSLPQAQDRAVNVKRTTLTEVATAEEVRPFEQLITRLFEDSIFLRTQAASCRDRFYAFAKAHEHGLRREFESAAARRAAPTTPEEVLWTEAVDNVRARGVGVVSITPQDCTMPKRGAGGDDPAADDGAAHGESDGPSDTIGGVRLEVLSTPMDYRVVHKPMVFVRTAPATDASVLSALPTGTRFSVDVVRRGWVRVAVPIEPMGGGKAHRGWALIDGSTERATAGIGALLERVV